MKAKRELIQSFLDAFSNAKKRGLELQAQSAHIKELKLQESNPLYRLLNFKVKKSLILPAGFDYFRVFDVLMFDKKETKFLEARWGNIANEQGLIVANADEVPNEFIQEELRNPGYIHPKDKTAKKLPVLKHSSRSSETIESIVNTGALINFSLSSGVASQPDICMTTDILGKSLQKTILKKYTTPMVWYHTDFNEELYVGNSAYQMGDRTTIKCNQESLPIGIHAYSKDNQLIITDPEAFITWNYSSLVISSQISDLVGLYNLGALIVDVGKFDLKDKSGNNYDLASLTDLTHDKLLDVVETSLLSISEKCDQKENASHSLRFERVFRENRESSREKNEAIQRFQEDFSAQPEIKKALEASGLGELVELSEEKFRIYKSS